MENNDNTDCSAVNVMGYVTPEKTHVLYSIPVAVINKNARVISWEWAKELGDDWTPLGKNSDYHEWPPSPPYFTRQSIDGFTLQINAVMV